jgi:hypothetical protein
LSWRLDTCHGASIFLQPMYGWLRIQTALHFANFSKCPRAVIYNGRQWEILYRCVASAMSVDSCIRETTQYMSHLRCVHKMARNVQVNVMFISPIVSFVSKAINNKLVITTVTVFSFGNKYPIYGQVLSTTTRPKWESITFRPKWESTTMRY